MDPLSEAKQLFLDALAAQEKGDLEQAEGLYRKALALAPGRPSVMNNLAAVYIELKKYSEAKLLCERLLEMNPEDETALLNLGNCQLKLNSAEDALVSYEKALGIRPDYVDALANRGNALLEMKRPEEALASHDRALALKPDHFEALYNRGNALLEADRPEEALASYDRALGIKPDSVEVLYKSGNALQELGRFDESARCFERFLLQKGDHASAQHDLALARLFLQEFESAWPGYEWRLKSTGIREHIRKDPATVERYEKLPRWRGLEEALAGELGIWGEQGIGDHVLFSTLIPELIETGVPFVYEVDRRLLKAYERAFPGSRFVALEEPPQDALRQASRVLLAGSLPGLFRRSRASFARQPRRLLSALPERVAHYRGRMDALGPGLKVALSWRSTREGRMGRGKSVPLIELAPPLALSGAHLVDVQYGDTRAERQATEDATGVRLLHFDEVDYYRDLEEVLAILEACDVLITTSNASAHFAGALGKPVWLLYLADKPPFHYWAHDGSHRCLWYPSVEVVSAPHLTEWGALIGRVKERLTRDLES